MAKPRLAAEDENPSVVMIRKFQNSWFFLYCVHLGDDREGRGCGPVLGGHVCCWRAVYMSGNPAQCFA